MGQTQIAGTHNFETEILTSNGDTMLYVFTWNGSQWVYLKHNDDCFQDPMNACPVVGVNSHLRSKVRVNLGVGVYYLAVVLAYMSFSGASSSVRRSGNAHLKVQRPNEPLLHVITNQFFGGDGVRVNHSSLSQFSPYDPTNTYSYETTSRPQPLGIYQPLLMPVKCNGEALAYQQGGGVGHQTRWTGSQACVVYLATSAGSSAGNQYDTNHQVNLIVNDALLAGRDQDQDGLGFRLESEIGTCDRPEQVLIQNPHRRCDDSLFNPDGQPVQKIRSWLEFVQPPIGQGFLSVRYLDTDGDGISDFEEVYGREMLFGHPTPPIQVVYDYVDLPRYGATPSIKDLSKYTLI